MVLLYLNVVFFSFFLKKFRLNSPLPSAMYIFFFFFFCHSSKPLMLGQIFKTLLCRNQR